MRLIFARDLNGGIGFKNALPWSIAEDMKFFKSKIKNKITIAGHKTFNSVPFTVTKKIEQTRVAELRKEYGSFYIIGGAATYASVMPFLQAGDVIYETKIYDIFEADTFFKPQLKKGTYVKKVIFDGECLEKKKGKAVRVKITKKTISFF